MGIIRFLKKKVNNSRNKNLFNNKISVHKMFTDYVGVFQIKEFFLQDKFISTKEAKEFISSINDRDDILRYYHDNMLESYADSNLYTLESLIKFINLLDGFYDSLKIHNKMYIGWIGYNKLDRFEIDMLQ